jgi:hypothetical protein
MRRRATALHRSFFVRGSETPRFWKAVTAHGPVENQVGSTAMPDFTIEGFVDELAKRSNIDPEAAETAVGTILSVIQQEANPSSVTQLFDHLPGATALAQKHVVVAGSGTGMGGALSSLAVKVIGADAGVMVAAVTQIEQTGLTLEQIKNIGGGLLSYIKDVDPALAKEISDTVPGLREHLA